ncbi:hypothetical protein CHS0354_019376, partial [Potamilus streckersoni]
MKIKIIDAEIELDPNELNRLGSRAWKAKSILGNDPGSLSVVAYFIYVKLVDRSDYQFPFPYR